MTKLALLYCRQENLPETEKQITDLLGEKSDGVSWSREVIDWHYAQTTNSWVALLKITLWNDDKACLFKLLHPEVPLHDPLD